MKIDLAAEDLMREALAGAVGREPERVGRAFLAIHDAGKQREATVIVLAVLRMALLRVQDGVPNEDENRGLAEIIAREEQWSTVTADEIYRVLEGISIAEEPIVSWGLAEDRITPALYITTGYLVSGYTDELGFDDWYDFLDDIVNTLIATPDDEPPVPTDLTGPDPA